ncbi:calpain-1 catalytic subunit-like [Sardina pilchardus]|uniref:calpain-1 catalytic subunit-like n=1 Tax=Sardina pilchardus TaxID=27697 RepID=UPI002E14B9FA
MPPPGVCLNVMNERNKKDDRGSVTNPDKFLGQDFREIQQYCLKNGFRFRDETFPPECSSIGDGLLQPNDLARVVWQRPRTMVKDPCFIWGGGVSRFDVKQGILGNCWFLAAIGALTFQDDIKRRIIPEEQSFQKDYAGIFHFRFWRFGRWVDVVIDDALPTIDGRLIFVQSKNPNEFWAALMEKAYAKVCGTYADMNFGNVSEALTDFTGGIHMTYKLAEAPPDLWDIMYRAAQSKSLMGCGTPAGATWTNTVLPNGLVEGHAYTITGIIKVMSNNRPVRLIRLFNPWGQVEWKGDWSDESSKWQTVSPDERKTCLSIRDDGEFWMSMEDFCQSYSDMDICSMSFAFLDASPDCHWTYKIHEGQWVTGTTAGGCLNNRDHFWTNPQYRIKLEALKSGGANDKDNNLFVSLMQKSDKRNRHHASNFNIGVSIFSYKRREGKFPKEFFMRKPEASSKNFLNAREVMEFFRLDPGEYIIVPSTFNPNETASFILSIYSKADSHLDENSTNGWTIIKYEEVDAEQLQRLLNENLLEGNSSGFGLDTCRSMVALMDMSDGQLNLLALRYGGSRGNLTLESFVHLTLRVECMSSKHQNAAHLICLMDAS